MGSGRGEPVSPLLAGRVGGIGQDRPDAARPCSRPLQETVQARNLVKSQDVFFWALLRRDSNNTGWYWKSRGDFLATKRFGPILAAGKRGPLPTPSKISVVSKKEIGQRLRTLRNARGFTQARLARILGTHQTGISQIEVGHRGLTVQQVVKLAKALRVSTDDILAQANGRVDGELVKDRHLLRRMQLIARLPKPEKKVLLQTIDVFLKSAHIT